ncbi:MAG: ABC transporter permease, partial [Thermodesulfobacteriota bacterium]
MKNPIAEIGNATLRLGHQTKNVLGLFFDTVFWIFTGPFVRKATSRESIFQQMVFAGVQSVVIVFFVSLFTGIVIAMQSAYQLKQLGAIIYV